LRSRPRARAIWETESPACQCRKSSTTSTTANILLAIRVLSVDADGRHYCACGPRDGDGAGQRRRVWPGLVRAPGDPPLRDAGSLISPSFCDVTARAIPGMVLVGVLLTGATMFFSAAVAIGFLSIVSVLGSLSPVVTTALAQVFLHERLGRWQWTGIVAVLVGVVLLTV